MTQEPTPPKELNDLDLLELVCQLHSRALNYPSSEMHNAYMEARKELEQRIKAGYAAAPAYEKLDNPALDICDALFEWANEKDKMTIHRGEFLELSKKLADLFAAAPAYNDTVEEKSKEFFKKELSKKVKDMESADLLELVCQLNARLAMHPSEDMHNSYWEARNELKERLAPAYRVALREKLGYVDHVLSEEGYEINCEVRKTIKEVDAILSTTADQPNSVQPLPIDKGSEGELAKALRDLIDDVKSKPNDTRYATKIKAAEQALSNYQPPQQ